MYRIVLYVYVVSLNEGYNICYLYKIMINFLKDDILSLYFYGKFFLEFSEGKFLGL